MRLFVGGLVAESLSIIQLRKLRVLAFLVLIDVSHRQDFCCRCQGIGYCHHLAA